MTASTDAARLALYDAIVGAAISWRAGIVPPVEFETDVARREFYDQLDAARRIVQRAGKHIVDGQVIRELAVVHRQGKKKEGHHGR